MLLAKYWVLGLSVALSMLSCKDGPVDDLNHNGASNDPELKSAFQPLNCVDPEHCCFPTPCPSRDAICCIQFPQAFGHKWLAFTSYTQSEVAATGIGWAFKEYCYSENTATMVLGQQLYLGPSRYAGEEFGIFTYQFAAACYEEAGQLQNPKPGTDEPYWQNWAYRVEGDYEIATSPSGDFILEGVDLFPMTGSHIVSIQECAQMGGVKMTTSPVEGNRSGLEIAWESEREICY